ncbi:DNA replication complex GINS protein SLD5-like [Symsagittifera roscoffensis]|uniref:DNA replication complex GINS protein SLD5-like n=1 Tax=Symsagittifera roscoffensis TaxID=84072 RepID=UPI00307BEAEE
MDIDPLFLDDDSFPPGDGNLNSVTSSRSMENGTSASQSRSQSSTAQKSYASTLLDDIVGLPPELQDGNDAIADDEIELSAQEVINQLKTAWINERFAPDLLDSKYELVTCLLDQISSMGRKLERVAGLIRERNASTSSVDSDHLRMEIHQMEIQRIRYLVSSYLRLRLNKIEQHVFYLLQQYRSQPPQAYSKMSPEELQFAIKLEQLYKTQLQSQVLDKLPLGIRKLEDQFLTREPNLNHYVFLKVNQTQKQVLIDENDPEGVVDLTEGTQYLVKYKTIAPLVENDSLSLI